MSTENWHKDFNPSAFLSRVNLDQLLEKNTIFNGASFCADSSPCVMCSQPSADGLVLNDKSILCLACYQELSLICYPEKYERLNRNYKKKQEAKRLAWEAFQKEYRYVSEESSLVLIGLGSALLAVFQPLLLIISIGLVGVGAIKNRKNQLKVAEWNRLEKEWKTLNPDPVAPTLKHFHDSTAELSIRDLVVLKVFENWPGYPPFWKYLRTVILSKDSNRCQVTGCPSRLGLHIHHILPVSQGGKHIPQNLVSLCDFHHALEPEKGHERIWADIKTRYFTLVQGHTRSNRKATGVHIVKPHIRRLSLVELDELNELTQHFRFACPNCGETSLKFSLVSDKSLVHVSCPKCNFSIEGPRQITEETGPKLAEHVKVTRNKGRWTARWDMLSERQSSSWGAQKNKAKVSAKRKQYREKVAEEQSAPTCPKCEAPMRLIKPRKGVKWKAFWGCTKYSVTGCRGSAKYRGS